MQKVPMQLNTNIIVQLLYERAISSLTRCTTPASDKASATSHQIGWRQCSQFHIAVQCGVGGQSEQGNIIAVNRKTHIFILFIVFIFSIYSIWLYADT